MLKSTEIYIDLGTANTLIYVRKKGFILNEPSCLALRARSYGGAELFALGKPSKLMLGKTPRNIDVFRPLKEGVIADFDKTILMLNGFMKRTKQSIGWIRPRMVISLPCRVTRPEKEAVRESALALGARKVFLVEEPVAAAIGAKLPIMAPEGQMVVDIGGGTTEIAIIASGGIVHANAVRVGGNHFDTAIIEYLREKHNFLIGEQTAELLKVRLGRAIMPEQSEHLEVGGIDAVFRMPRRRKISSFDIFEAIQPPLQEIVRAVQMALGEAPAEICSDLLERGMTLAGGGSLLKDLDKLIERETRVAARHSSEPLLAIAYGGAKALEDQSLLERIAI